MTNGNDTTQPALTRAQLEHVFDVQDADARHDQAARQRAAAWPAGVEAKLAALSGRVQALEQQLAGQAKA